MNFRGQLNDVDSTDKILSTDMDFYSPAYQTQKNKLHQLLIENIDLEKLQHLTIDQFKKELANLVDRISIEEKLMVNQLERRQLTLDMQYEMLGFGPIEPLLDDPSISDILVNTFNQIYVERRGRLELTPVKFNDNAHLLKVIEKIASRVGRRIDESSPMVDARLPDGSRVNAIIPPLAIDGPILSIRRFSVKPLSMADLLNCQSLPDLHYLVVAILVQRETGGNLAELLTKVAQLVRQRLKLQADVRVLSAEGRLSAWILCLLPPLAALFFYLTNPDYLQQFIADPAGSYLLWLVGGMQLIGVLIMRHIVRIRV